MKPGTIFILLGGGLLFLLLIAGIIFGIMKQDLIKSLLGITSKDSSNGEKEEEREVIFYKCHGSNFADALGKYTEPYNKTCSNDTDFKWADQVSCEQSQLAKMAKDGLITCPEGYSYLEGPEERPWDSCKNNKQGYGFKCYRREGYYDYDPSSKSFYSGLRALECCVGTKFNGEALTEKCSGRLCPGSALCNSILNVHCTDQKNHQTPICSNFCSTDLSGFPKTHDKQALVDALKDSGFKVKVVMK